jgi:hypothetical protein
VSTFAFNFDFCGNCHCGNAKVVRTLWKRAWLAQDWQAPLQAPLQGFPSLELTHLARLIVHHATIGAGVPAGPLMVGEVLACFLGLMPSKEFHVLGKQLGKQPNSKLV